MSQIRVPRAPMSAAEIRAAWNYTASPFAIRRRRTREVRIGGVGIGGDNPIRLQSMTISDTLDTEAVVAEITGLWRAGSELVRVTAPNRKCAEHLGVIREQLAQRGVTVPLVADIHFTPQAALIAAEHVDKVRINPGNYADRKHFKKWEYSDQEYEDELKRLDEAFSPLVERCLATGTAMRIGTNHGSLSDRILNRYGDTPRGMVESALEFVRICERHGYHDIVLSMKASDVKVMIQAYRLLAARMHELGMDYPFHLGVTEAGSGLSGRVKSAIGIGSLLQDGIGDTIRVSLTEDSVHEIPVCRDVALPFQDAFARPAAAQIETAESALPPSNPIQFERRNIVPQGEGPTRLAADTPPRIELVLPVAAEDSGARMAQATERPEALLWACDGTDADWAHLQQRLAAAPADAACVAGVELPAAALQHAALPPLLGQLQRLNVVVSRDDLPRLSQLLAASVGETPSLSLQYTLQADVLRDSDSLQAFLSALHDASLPAAAVALRSRHEGSLAHSWRRILARYPDMRLPIILRPPTPDAFDHGPGDLQEVMSLGALLVDGIGDAVQWTVRDDPTAALALAREVLQATRLRLSVADFIACPSCGRTQFDLQSTSARIQERFRHLEGLKIAIMGCIVNGPGEMADADFGYVGSGPGKIDLYVGHERVQRGIAEAEAVDRLQDLIATHGRWSEPSSRNPTGSSDVSTSAPPS